MTGFKCLCCGKEVLRRGEPVTPAGALRAYMVLVGMGHDPRSLVTEHRENLEYCAPGLVEWIEQHTV